MLAVCKASVHFYFSRALVFHVKVLNSSHGFRVAAGPELLVKYPSF